MLSRSLTSCLIKPLANGRVSEINSICCLKGLSALNGALS